MPVYQYRAKNRLGEEITGTYESADKADVVYMLRGKDYYPVLIKEFKKKPGSFSLKSFFNRITYKDLAVFCRQFSTVVNAGVPILASLDILRKQTENARLRETLNTLFEEVQKGKNLSLVMGMYKGIFPELLVNMVETGEISGTLDRVMDRMATHYEKEYKINQKVKNALVYPSLIAVVATLVVIFLVAVVLPTFASMFEQMGAVLPLSTRVLMRVSYFIRDGWLILLMGLVGALLGIRAYSNTEGGREIFDGLRLRMPIIGNVNRKVATARFARTLGALMSSGISLLQGIEVTKKVVGNAVVLKGLAEVEDDIKRGKGLAEPLKKIEAFPPMLTHMAKIGEDTGTLDYILEKTADFYDEEVESAVTRMTTLLEPAIIVVMAVVVAFIVISIVIPMFDMMTRINF
ncbi:MAG: Type IV fimbrial assembly protein PilC [Firmicutes bacterium]|nr:Type IV fimbrial assembly protein PilC [Bacillota bacterium]MDI6705421.1 type II secretion system F family protein [Bacillota bacterium]